jgi:hypothetical protein
MSRFLMAWPNSTIGTRIYRAGDLDAAPLRAFDDRVRALLDAKMPLDEDGTLKPPKIRLSSAALEAWRALHDNVERELHRRGEFTDLIDIGAKSAEQASRIACVLHVLEQGPKSEISQATFLGAGKIALWHLYEARRFLA